MLAALERGRMRGMDLPRRYLEGGDQSPFVSSLGERIATRAGNLPQAHGLLTGLREWDQGRAAEAEVAPPTLDYRAQDPALRPVGSHEQIEATTIGDPLGPVPRSCRLDRACAPGHPAVSQITPRQTSAKWWSAGGSYRRELLRQLCDDSVRSDIQRV